jgi:hypothetical protein
MQMSPVTASDNSDVDGIKRTKIPNLKERQYALLGAGI